MHKNMRDEAFSLRKKKASCGNYPRTFIFFTKADALSLQCPAVPVMQHNFGPFTAASAPFFLSG
jgi:hypothetical protein